MKRHLTSCLLLVALFAPLPSRGGGIEIGWANLQWPPTYFGPSCGGGGIYGQVWIDGVTSQPGPTPGLVAELGFGPPASVPDQAWLWIRAQFNVDAGNNDEFVVQMIWYLPVGNYDYGYRYSYNGGPWFYADLNGPSPGGPFPNPGTATILDSCGAVATQPSTWGTIKSLF